MCTKRLTRKDSKARLEKVLAQARENEDETEDDAPPEATKSDERTSGDNLKIDQNAVTTLDEVNLHVKIEYHDDRLVQHTFNTKEDLRDQVERFCDSYQIPFDHDENFQVLYRTTPRYKQRYCVTRAELEEMEDGCEVKLTHGIDFVHNGLMRIMDLVEIDPTDLENPDVQSLEPDELLKCGEALLKNVCADGQACNFLHFHFIFIFGRLKGTCASPYTRA